MEQRPLGASGLAISPVGVGTAPMGSGPDWWLHWGTQADRDSGAAIHAALDAGVNWIDTAPFYGWGRAEAVVGRALRGRDDVLVFTKCGTFRRRDGDDFMDLRPESVRRDVEESLRRLGRERIDLLQPHDLDRSVPVEETWGAVMELVAEGKVRFGGLSNHPVELVERALAVGPVVSLQHQYSLLAREAEHDVLPFAHARGLGFLCWSPLASGFLADGFDLEALALDDFRRTHRFAEKLPQIERLRGGLIAATGAAAAASALAWLLRRPGVTGAIVGIRNAAEGAALAEAVQLAGRARELDELDPDLWL